MSLSLLKAGYRRLYWLPSDLAALRRAGNPDWVVYFGGKGFGDDLLLSAVIHELRRRQSGRLAVITRLTEIFAHSPDVDCVLNEDWPVLDAQLRRGRHGVHPLYYRGLATPDIDIAPPGHIIAEMCRQIGLDGEVRLRPRIFLQPAELASGLRTTSIRLQVAIQCMSAASVNAAPNKVWPTDRYQRVVDQNRDRFDFVQLGSLQDTPLAHTLDLRGQTTIRESASILARSAAAVCYVGFLMHLARAVDCRSVTIFGGREHPSNSGYPCNENLFTSLPCSPCWRQHTCVAEHACMTAIAPEEVTAALDRLLARRETPLELTCETLR
jgi:ADP-heptose:LPS heptosyltransferase